jgi:GNAT superfamily N-acetyltransferase
LRLPGEDKAFGAAVGAALDLTEGIENTLWNIGPSSRPGRLVDRLRQLGFRDPQPPFDPIAAAMILTDEPPAADGVEVRRIETFDEHRAGLEIMLAADTWSPQAAAEKRALARQTFERRTRHGSMQWLALVEGMPAAFALAVPAPVGLYLAGGATHPEARGRGCYRALVRARWDEAQRLGLPGLAVQAQYDSSAPILRRLGFIETAAIHTLRPPLPLSP